MALPRGSSGPRVITGDAVPQSAIGQSLVSEDLTKQMKKVFYTLLAVGLIQMTCGAILLVALKNNPAMTLNLPILLLAQFGVAGVFIVLSIWSRKAPLPAAIVGLVIYATLVILNVVNAISNMSAGGPKTGIGGLGIGWLDIVIMAVLVQGIQAGIKYRKLQEASAR
ncbi:MAG: hypothetical protein ACHRHE_02430 [Tepidisphaerales bacterium]